MGALTLPGAPLWPLPPGSSTEIRAAVAAVFSCWSTSLVGHLRLPHLWQSIFSRHLYCFLLFPGDYRLDRGVRDYVNLVFSRAVLVATPGNLPRAQYRLRFRHHCEPLEAIQFVSTSGRRYRTF